MNSTPVDVDELRHTYEEAERRREDASHAEQTAYETWLEAQSRYESARDAASSAWWAYESMATH